MIIFLYGKNQYAAKQYLARQQSMFLEKVGEDSLKVIDGKTASLSEIGLALNTGSLFSQKRMVIVEDVFSTKKPSLLSELHKYLGDKKIASSPDVIIFYSEKTDYKGAEKKFFDYLKKQEHSKEFPILSTPQIASWIKKELSNNKVTIDNNALQELIFRCSADQWQLDQEIKKLSHYKKNISLNDIKDLVIAKHDDNIFALSDSLSARNKKAATEIFQELLAADLDASYISNMIYKHLKNLTMIKALLETGSSENQIVSETGLHPYVVKKSLTAARNFPENKLIEIMRGLLEIEYNIRHNQGNVEKDMAILIASI